MRTARRIVAGSALVCAAIHSSMAAHAGEPETYGFGSRASAMAGATTADASDFSGGFYNPAALASAEGTEVAIGYTYNQNHLRVDGEDTNVDSVHGIFVGLAVPGELFDVPFAFGVASHIPDDGLSRITALRQEVPRWELYDHRNATLFLAANLAVRPVRWLEIGGGVGFLAATRGRLEVVGEANVLRPYDSQLRHEVDADLTSVRYPMLGARVKVADWGFVGLTYRGGSKLDLQIEAELRGRINFAGIDVPLLYQLETATIDGFTPAQVVLGFSLAKIDHLKINADLQFIDWAAYESPTASTSARLRATPPPGTPVDLPADTSPVDIIPPNFESRFVPRLGVEYTFVLDERNHPPPNGANRDGDPNIPVLSHQPKSCEGRCPGLELPVRAGYSYEASPVPPQTGITNFIDTDRHTMTAGVGIALHGFHEIMPGSVHLDIAGQISVMPSRTIEKNNPADFVGDYQADGTMAGVSSTLRLVF